MKPEQVFFVASAFGALLVTACGGSTKLSSADSGATADGSGSGSGSSGSGSGSSSGIAGGSGSGSSGGGNTEAGGPTIGACPGTCKGSCCLTMVNGQLEGTCAASKAACGGSLLECSAADECPMGTSCCASIVSGGPSGASCLAACPTGSPFACGHGGATDNKDCPGGPAGWTCDSIPGTPTSIFNQCTTAAISDAGTPDTGSADTGASETGTPDTGTSTDAPSGG